MIVLENIQKNRTLLNSEDYAFLREAGQQYLESLGTTLWTDFNVHDPGITILEALCYAITELGYRTNLDIKDILAPAPGEDMPPQVLFTAAEILTSNPVTETDYRKLLVDIDGIHNAFLYIANQEVAFHAACKTSELSYYLTNERIKLADLGKGDPDNDLIQNWMDAGGTTGQNDSIKLKYTLDYQADDGNGGLVARQFDVSLSFPGWNLVYLQLGSFMDFLNHDFTGEANFVTTGGEQYNLSAAEWLGNLIVNSAVEPALNNFIISEVLAKPVAGSTQRLALENFLRTGEAVRDYRNLLHKSLLKLLFHNIVLRGLYGVLLEFDDDDEYGDLNSHIVEYTLSYKVLNQLKEVDLEIHFPSWQDLFADLETYYEFIKSNLLDAIYVEAGYYDPAGQFWEFNLSVDYDGMTGPTLPISRVVVRGISNLEELNEVRTQILLTSESSMVGFFHKKLGRILTIYEAVLDAIHSHRNLCEDWPEVTGVGVNDVALCADVDLSSDANIEDVLAQIYFEVEQYFSPDIKFYSLKELADEGIPTEDIFDGPSLKHGFIKSDEIEAAKLKEFIYTSDIINIIMDIPGVEAVRNVLLTKYDEDGNPVLPSAKWCLAIDPHHKPKLHWNKSKVLFFKDELPFKLNENKQDRMEFIYNQLKAKSERLKLITTELNYPIPEGTYLGVDAYTTSRHLFPQAYGVGPAGLSSEETVQRHAKAVQLKSFLLFYDQLLANYFSQLANVKELFSVKEYATETDERTYFEQYLEESDIGGSLYADVVKLQESLHGMTESEPIYLDRRNRFLDHLLSRFAEDFTEYTLLMHSIDGLRAPRELIHDKISFLEEYDVISRDRGKAFNYKDETALWDSGNVSGLEKRVSKLLGIESYDRRFLHCPTICDRFTILTIGQGPGLPPKYEFQLNDFGIALLHSTKQFDSYDDAVDAIEELLDLAVDIDNYSFQNEGSLADPKFFIYINDGLDKKARSVLPVKTKVAADEYGQALRKRFRLDFEIDLRKDVSFYQKSGSTEWSFSITTEGKMLVGYRYYLDTIYEAWTKMEEFLVLATDPVNYGVRIATGKYTAVILKENVFIARFTEKHLTENLAKATFEDLSEMFKTIDEECLNTEGMHLVEHILLRPKNEFEDAFFEVCLDNECKLCGQEDPYSYRASVILPYWSNRFKDDELKFREFVDKRLRLEAPAPVHLKICWISNKQMRRFELRFKAWLEENAKMFPDPVILTQRLNGLIDILGKLKSVYPQATLHDCELSETDNRVILNKTVLGSFDTTEETTNENNES